MPDHYDALETRDPGSRERRQAAALPGIVARAMTAPGWGKHLKGIDTKSVNSRAALAKLPVLRKADLTALQKENPPFGGLNVTAPGQARRLLMSPGPIFEPEGVGKDWWGSARALFAAGFRQTGMAAAERGVRGITLGRKSWLFCGSDRGGERAAVMYSLIVTAKMNDVDPQAWLADVLARIAEHPVQKLDELLPWNWGPLNAQARQAA